MNTTLLCDSAQVSHLPGAFPEPLPPKSRVPLGLPQSPGLPLALPSSLCVVTLCPSVQLPHFTDMETEVQKGEVARPRQSQAKPHPGLSRLPHVQFCCFPFLKSRGGRDMAVRGLGGRPALLPRARSCARVGFLGRSPGSLHPPNGPAR